MYIYIYVCMYIYICMYVCMYVCMYNYIYIYSASVYNHLMTCQNRPCEHQKSLQLDIHPLNYGFSWSFNTWTPVSAKDPSIGRAPREGTALLERCLGTSWDDNCWSSAVIGGSSWGSQHMAALQQGINHALRWCCAECGQGDQEEPLFTR